MRNFCLSMFFSSSSLGPGYYTVCVMTLLRSFNLLLCNFTLSDFSLIFLLLFFMTFNFSILLTVDCRFWQFVLSSLEWRRVQSRCVKAKRNDLSIQLCKMFKLKERIFSSIQIAFLEFSFTMHIVLNCNRYIIIVHYCWYLSARKILTR